MGVAKWSRMHRIVCDEPGFDSSATRAMSFDETLPQVAARRGTIAKTRHHPRNTRANADERNATKPALISRANGNAA